MAKQDATPQQLAVIEKNQAALKSMLSAEATKKRFNEILGKKGPGFISSIVSAVNGSAELQKCEPQTVIGAAAIAASLDLPIVPGLGFAGIVPFWNTKKGVYEGQFQIFKKGFIQLAQRSGQIKTIHSGAVYDGQLKHYNPFTGDFEFDINGKKSEKVIGYVAYMRFINGFEKYKYMTIEELTKHGKKYSQSFRKGWGKWADKEEGGFEQMCEKTVIKLLLSGYAPLSIEMQNAIVYDQATIADNTPHYIDNQPTNEVDAEKAKQRIKTLEHIEKCNTIEELDILIDSDVSEYGVEKEIEKRRAEILSGVKAGTQAKIELP